MVLTLNTLVSDTVCHANWPQHEQYCILLSHSRVLPSNGNFCFCLLMTVKHFYCLVQSTFTYAILI